MGLFSGIEKAEAYGGSGGYVMPGRSIVMIKSLIAKEYNDGETGVIVECENLANVNPNTENEEGDTRLGNIAVHYKKKLGNQAGTFLATIKIFVSNLVGCEVDEVDEETCEWICGEENPFAGYVCQLDSHIITKKNGDPFTKTVFTKRLSDPEKIQKLVGEDKFAEYEEEMNLHIAEDDEDEDEE